MMALNNTKPNSSMEDTIMDSPAATAMGALIMSLVFFLGLPGNIFVIWSIVARARKRNITTLLILNLAIADGFLVALTPFFISYLVLKDWVYGGVMCKVLYYLCLLNMYASIYLITIMSLYRLVAIVWPHQVRKITGQRKMRRVLAVMWCLVMVASVPRPVYRNVRVKQGSSQRMCDWSHEPKDVVTQYMLELVIGFLIPYIIILASYACILKKIRKIKFQRRIRSEKLCLAIVVTFCVFWLPYHIMNMVQVIAALYPDGEGKKILDKTWHKSQAFAASFAFISSCANPVLYFLAGKSYLRREGLAFMARLFELTGLELATRKSRQNSQNSRDKDKEANSVILQEKNQESVTDSSSNLNHIRPIKNGK